MLALSVQHEPMAAALGGDRGNQIHAMSKQKVTLSEAQSIIDNPADDRLPYPVVNQAGLMEIRALLERYHTATTISDEMVKAYAASVEEQMNVGNPAIFEIPQKMSIVGKPVVCAVSDAGLEWVV